VNATGQIAIPCILMRGGTSKGPFFLASDLPADPVARDRVLLAVMGSPDPRQIDGLGDADPLTSKVGIVSPSKRPGVDIDFLFAQVAIEKPTVDFSPNCGNMLAAAGPFAIETGLVAGRQETTPVTIYMVNSGNLAIAHVRTPAGKVNYEGDASISGVPGKAAPIAIDFLHTAGSACGVMLPTGSVLDRLAGIEVTCIDNGMPVVIMKASDLGKAGHESPAELDSDQAFKHRLEEIRLEAGQRMGLGNVGGKVIPKMTLISMPSTGGALCTRTFIPHRCHAAIGVLGAVSVATACVLRGSVADQIACLPESDRHTISVEHPSGELTVELEVDVGETPLRIRRSGLLRTARALMQGHVYVPNSLFWAGPGCPPQEGSRS
jgi:4-oxalomesaconate tautomerase